MKFPNPGALGVSESELLQVSEPATEVSESGGRKVSEAMGPQVSESDVEVSESQVGHRTFLSQASPLTRLSSSVKLIYVT